MSTHPSQHEPPTDIDCFYCGREASGFMTGLPEVLHPDHRAPVCGECYQLILDVEADIRFIDMFRLWVAEDGSLETVVDE